jgi:hypothetical protein
LIRLVGIPISLSLATPRSASERDLNTPTTAGMSSPFRLCRCTGALRRLLHASFDARGCPRSWRMRAPCRRPGASILSDGGGRQTGICSFEVEYTVMQRARLLLIYAASNWKENVSDKRKETREMLFPILVFSAVCAALIWMGFRAPSSQKHFRKKS